MNASIIVHGPQGCGKTRNAERMRKALGLSRVIDTGLERMPDSHIPHNGVLVLTNDANLRASPGIHRVSFEVAMRMVRLLDKTGAA